MLDYILVTPVRNEQDTLPFVIHSMVAQTHKPLIWLIVNDGSTDGTEEIISEVESRHSWIHSRTLPLEPGGLGVHFAKVVRFGFDEIKALTDENELAYELIGKIDADVFFKDSCFESLANKFEEDRSLGIASPRLVYYLSKDRKETLGDRGQFDVALSDHPTDGVRLYRRECYEDIGGIQITRAPETIAEAKAAMGGWKLRRFDDIHAGTSRLTHHSTTLWSRWVMAGSEAWFVGYNPIIVLGRVVFELLFGRPIYRGIAYGYGYFLSCIRRETQHEDPSILSYFRDQRLAELTKQIGPLFRKGIARNKREPHE